MATGETLHGSGLTIDQSKRPDISYHPDEAKWRALTARRLAEDPSLPHTPLPEGFPKQLAGPLVWEGKQWADEDLWVYSLSEEELQEIDKAVHYFEDSGHSLTQVDRTTFPLPKLSHTLHNLAAELYAGRGFFLLRSIPTSNYTPFQNTLIYLGISAYIAPTIASQDPSNGSMVGHITDLSSKGENSGPGAPAYRNVSQPFHSDPGDIVSLFALGEAEEGGESKLVSAWRVYNELAETRPDLVKVLAEPFPLEVSGVLAANRNAPYQLRPFLYKCPQDDRIVIQFSRRLATGFPDRPRSPAIPPLTEAQAEAVDALHFLSEKHCLTMKLRIGDIQYVSNLGLFHAREGFVDSPQNKRHLLRLWLRNEEMAWPTPPALQVRYNNLFKKVPEEKQRFPVEPEVRSMYRGPSLENKAKAIPRQRGGRLFRFRQSHREQQKNDAAFTLSRTTMSRKKTLEKRGKRLAAARAKKQHKRPEKPVGLFVTKELGDAIEACKAKVESISKECRARNKRFRDIEFDLEFDGHLCLHGLSSFIELTGQDVQRVTEIFDEPHFYPPGGAANSNSIRQGKLGDCWFLSALATVSSFPDLIEKICVARDEEVGVYGFIFYGDKGWTSVVIDDMLFTDIPKYEELDQESKTIYHYDKQKYERIARKHGKSLLYAKAGSQEETWVPLIEKAYAKYYGNYSHLEAGWTREAIEDLTGGVATAFIPKDILDTDKFWKEELLKANKDRMFACSFSGVKKPFDHPENAPVTLEGLFIDHAYAVLRTVECRGKRFVVLRNPWGRGEWTGAWSDGSKEWTSEWVKALPELGHTFGDDGQFVMDYEEFLKCFNMIERTYLFDDSWIVSSQWLNVTLSEQPAVWTYGKFSCIVKIPARTKVILVLSQLNNRAFRSIRKSTTIMMDIAVVKKGDKTPIEVASEPRPFNCRSISVELELGAGEYYVYIRLDQSRMIPVDGICGVEYGYSASCRTVSRIVSRKADSYSLALNWVSSARHTLIARSLQQVIQDDLDQIAAEELAKQSAPMEQPDGPPVPVSPLASGTRSPPLLPLVDEIPDTPEESNAPEEPPVQPRLRRRRQGKKRRTNEEPDGSPTKPVPDPLSIIIPGKDTNASVVNAENPPSPSNPQQGLGDEQVDRPVKSPTGQDTEWTGWSAVFYVGLLNILALLGLTIIGTPESHLPPHAPGDHEPNLESEPAERGGGSDSESVASSRRSSQRSRSRSGSPPGSRTGSPPPTPLSPLESFPPPPGQEWKDLLKDETGNVVLGLRVYTQTKDPAEIVWRLAV